MINVVHDVVVPSGAVGSVLLEASVGGRSEGSGGLAELEEVALMGDTLGSIGDIGAAIIIADVGVSAGAIGRVVDGFPFGGEEGGGVVLMDHDGLILIRIILMDGEYEME